MFTGIVTESGSRAQARDARGVLDLEIEAPELARQIEVGDSVAVNGVCLTATDTSRKTFSTQAMDETLDVTTTGSLVQGQRGQPGAGRAASRTVSAGTWCRDTSTTPLR